MTILVTYITSPVSWDWRRDLVSSGHHSLRFGSQLFITDERILIDTIQTRRPLILQCPRSKWKGGRCWFFDKYCITKSYVTCDVLLPVTKDSFPSFILLRILTGSNDNILKRPVICPSSFDLSRTVWGTQLLYRDSCLCGSIGIKRPVWLPLLFRCVFWCL